MVCGETKAVISVDYPLYSSPLKLQVNEAKRCMYPLRLDAYGSGCDHHCSYCYARAQMIVGGWNNSRNPKHPFPRVADINCLHQMLTQMPEKKPACVSGSWKQIRPLLLNKLPLRLGAVTDCFQRYMESRTHTGLELLRILTEARYPAQIVTKSDLIADDEYIEAMRENKDNLLIQLSITTAYDSVSRRLEPGAPLSSLRMQALGRLIEEGFFTAGRINPLFPIYPDATLSSLSARTGLRGVALLQNARRLDSPTLPIFDLKLVNDLLKIFKRAPRSTIGRHTLLAGFVRLPFATLKWVSQTINWQREMLKSFFHISKGNCYYYSREEIRHYYEAMKELCTNAGVPFSVCYDSDDNYETFRDLWADPKDCCNALGNVPGFKKVHMDCCQRTTS